ncbi:MAG: RAMP superfamily CRISPR-associated protein [Micrococcales bacterium]|nr:RAMP superfamily CRISPR-associated protein [Micrococcales bacterium]
MTDFVNPYNFISLPPRDQPALADSDPCSERPRGAYAPDTYSGVIPISLTARTPLLLMDQPRGEPYDVSRHLPRQVRTRRRADDPDVPLLLGSSVRGMLRSAYEAITSSRFGVFDKDSRSVPGAVRLRPQSALDMRMGYVSRVDSGGRPELRVVMALTPDDDLRPEDKRSSDGLVSHIDAPSLPIELGRRFAESEGLQPGRLDRMEVTAQLVLRHHQRVGPNAAYTFWQAESLTGPSGTTVPGEAQPSARVANLDVRITVRGIIHWTGSKFINRKKDERIVPCEVLEGSGDVFFRVFTIDPEHTAELRWSWDAVCQSFRDAHENDDTTSARFRADHGSYIWDTRSWKLERGRTFHCRPSRKFTDAELSRFDEVERRPDANDIAFLTPALIGREPFTRSAWELLDPLHRPASRIEALSPADVVFGWVPQGDQPNDGRQSQTGWKGLLQVDPPWLRSSAETAISEDLGEEHGMELATLAEPKTSQYRFYSASRRADGEPQPSGEKQPRSADQGFTSTSELRGRKVYLPHPDRFVGDEGPAEQKNPAWADRITDGSEVPPHLRPRGSRSPKVEVNVRDWVVPGTEFRTEIRFAHLTETELGALLWILKLEGSVFGLGGGKPLGFGSVSVRADWDRTVVEKESDTRERYSQLRRTPSQPTDVDLGQLFKKFNILLDANPETRLMRDQLVDSTRGFPGIPVHYPRTRQQNDRFQGGATTGSDSELFKWWVENERGARLGLPMLGQRVGRTRVSPALPHHPEQQQNQPRTQQGRGNRRQGGMR